MVEVVGDLVVPSELILPLKESNHVGKEGSLFLSGAKLHFHDGTKPVAVTSA